MIYNKIMTVKSNKEKYAIYINSQLLAILRKRSGDKKMVSYWINEAIEEWLVKKRWLKG